MQPAGCSAAKSALHESISYNSPFVRPLFYRDWLALVNRFFSQQNLGCVNSQHRASSYWHIPVTTAGAHTPITQARPLLYKLSTRKPLADARGSDRSIEHFFVQRRRQIALARVR